MKKRLIVTGVKPVPAMSLLLYHRQKQTTCYADGWKLFRSENIELAMYK